MIWIRAIAPATAFFPRMKRSRLKLELAVPAGSVMGAGSLRCSSVMLITAALSRTWTSSSSGIPGSTRASAMVSPRLLYPLLVMIVRYWLLRAAASGGSVDAWGGQRGGMGLRRRRQDLHREDPDGREGGVGVDVQMHPRSPGGVQDVGLVAEGVEVDERVARRSDDPVELHPRDHVGVGRLRVGVALLDGIVALGYLVLGPEALPVALAVAGLGVVHEQLEPVDVPAGQHARGHLGGEEADAEDAVADRQVDIVLAGGARRLADGRVLEVVARGRVEELHRLDQRFGAVHGADRGGIGDLELELAALAGGEGVLRVVGSAPEGDRDREPVLLGRGVDQVDHGQRPAE